MRVSRRRVGAIVRKEFQEYRRNRQTVATMAILPIVFLIQPLLTVFLATASSATFYADKHYLLYMLGIPALVPAAVAAVSIVGERQQGTLEPVLTTPIRREEFLLAKAVAPLIPSVAVAYGVFALYLACIELFAAPAVATALVRGSDLLAQLIFTPLIASWSIWLAIVISGRSNDIRAAQQLSLLASLPSVALSSLIAYNVIHATLGLAVALAGALLVANRLGWRLASATFDRERLITR